MDYINTLPSFLKKYIFELALTGASCGKLMSVCKSWKKFIEEKMMVPDWRLLDLLESRCTNLSSRNKKFNLQDIIKINKSLLRGQSGYFITMNKICRSAFQELQTQENNGIGNLFCFLVSGRSWVTLTTEAYRDNKSIVIDKKHNVDEVMEYITKSCNLFFELKYRKQQLEEPNLDTEKQLQMEREVTKLKIELENTMLILLDEIKKWLKNPMKTQHYNELMYFGGPIPEALWSLNHLVKLDLSGGGDKLCTLSKKINELKFLEELNLENNKLKELPELPPSLKILNISFNRFKEFPVVIENLEQLVELIFEGNLLSSIPKTIQEKFLDQTNKIFETTLFKELSYEATSELATIYQGTLLTKSKRKMYNLLERLIQSYPELIYSLYTPNFIELHQGIFGLARHLVGTSSQIVFLIQSVVEQKYFSLFRYQENKVHYNIWKFSGSPQTDNPNWGKDHATKNFSILSDALVLSDIQYQSPLARLCVALADYLPTDTIKQMFERCSQNDKNAIEKLIWETASNDGIDIAPWDHEYGKYHAFDSFIVLEKAIMTHIFNLFNSMEENRNIELQLLILKLDRLNIIKQTFLTGTIRLYSLIAEAIKMLDDQDLK